MHVKAIGRGHDFAKPNPGIATDILERLFPDPPAADQARDACVLVLDEEDGTPFSARTVLHRANYRVITAWDGAEALALYAEHRDDISIVLTGLLTRYLDGAALIRSLRWINPGVRIIVASRLPVDIAERTPGGLACDAFLPKPCPSGTLLATVDDVLRRTRRRPLRAVGTTGQRSDPVVMNL